MYLPTQNTPTSPTVLPAQRQPWTALPTQEAAIIADTIANAIANTIVNTIANTIYF